MPILPSISIWKNYTKGRKSSADIWNSGGGGGWGQDTGMTYDKTQVRDQIK